jgi:hypothetical protein
MLGLFAAWYRSGKAWRGEKADSHDSDHPLDMTIFWGCYRPGINQGEMSSKLNIKDTSAVVASALGLPIPKKWEAVIPEGLFTNCSSCLNGKVLQVFGTSRKQRESDVDVNWR